MYPTPNVLLPRVNIASNCSACMEHGRPCTNVYPSTRAHCLLSYSSGGLRYHAVGCKRLNPTASERAVDQRAPGVIVRRIPFSAIVPTSKPCWVLAQIPPWTDNRIEITTFLTPAAIRRTTYFHGEPRFCDEIADRRERNCAHGVRNERFSYSWQVRSDLNTLRRATMYSSLLPPDE